MSRIKIELRRSEIRSRLGEITALTGDELTEDIQTERDGLMQELSDSEPQLRAAIAAEGEELEQRSDELETPEVRERLDLRGKALIGNYIKAHHSGKQPSGPELELQQAAKVDGIPLEIFETREVLEQRTVTPSPATKGVNMAAFQPAVFAPSIAARLNIEMPMVESGTYATGTITTSVTAAPKAKSADVPATAGAITTKTTTPHRIGGRLELTLEDIAAVGQDNFESVLRDNVSLVLSDKLDDQIINGSGGGANLTGLIARLSDPTDPSDIADFDAFIAAYADSIDGLWASTMKEIMLVAGTDTYKLSAKAFRDKVTNAGVSQGSISAADYLREHTAGWWTNKRMPAAASNIQAAIVCRKGRPGIRTAVCPHWGYIGIDDVYSGSGKGERYFTLSVLVGDVILMQPDAYARVDFKVS